MSSEEKKEIFVKELKNKLSLKAHGSTTEEQVLLRAFKYFDLDNSGVCSQDEFLRTMSKIGITSFNQQEIFDMFPLFDQDGSGSLDYREFVAMLYGNKSITSKKPQQQKYRAEEEQPEYYQEKEVSQRSEPNQNDSALDIIRQKLISRGVQGITSLARNFRIIDDNNTQTIDIEEFKKCCKDFQFGLNERQMDQVFRSFDRDNSGVIDYDEFLRSVRGEMNEFRKNLVQQAFKKLDINGSGEITFDEIQSLYDTKNNPEVIDGKKTEEEVIQQFMDTFQDTYNYLCGTENDNKITIEEFMEYYENVSMSIDDDAYFELLINNSWGLGDYNPNKYKKGWSNKNEEQELNNDTLEKRYQEKFGDRRPGQNGEEAIDDPIRKFRKEILKKGSGGLISLARQFKIFDENGNKQLDIDEFTKAIKENRINLSNEEIETIFNNFDRDGSGFIDYDEFVREVRGPMNEKRAAVVKQAFNKLDIDRSGVVDMYEIKSLYSAKNHKDVKSGRKTEEEVYADFMDTFQAHHYLKSGVRNKRVTLEEFLEYYNHISMNIDDDDYFVFMVQNAWRLNPSTYSRPKHVEEENVSLPLEKSEPRQSQPPSRPPENYENNEKNVQPQQDDLRNRQRERDFNKRQAPYYTEDDVPQFEKKGNVYESQPIIKSGPLINKFRELIAKRGSRGIMSARREFMIADDDNSKTIDLNELQKFCHDYRLPFNAKECETLLREFDTDRSGKIDYNEFLRGIVGEMNDRRRQLITRVFKIFDKNGNGLIELDDVRDSYNVSNHPDVKSGKKTEDEALAEFLDTFEYQFNLLHDNKTKDGKITLDEFLEYYNNISMSIDNDDYFDEMIKSAYNLDNRRTNKKAWRGEY